MALTNIEKATENRVRRKLARRMGYTLERNRVRDPKARDYGHYYVRDEGGGLVDHFRSLAELARWCDD